MNEPLRIPLRLAGGKYAFTGRYDGDIGSRSGRHASGSKDRTARALRKRQRRGWKAAITADV